MLTVEKSRLLSHASVSRKVTSVSQSTLHLSLSFRVRSCFCFSTTRRMRSPQLATAYPEDEQEGTHVPRLKHKQGSTMIASLGDNLTHLPLATSR